MLSSTTLFILILFVEVGLIALGYGLVCYLRRRGAANKGLKQLQSLVDVLASGVVLCSGLRILAANQSLLRLVGMDSAKFQDWLIADFICDHEVIDQLMQDEPVTLETDLRTKLGETIPVEIAARSIHHFGERQRLLEIRDIRERKASQERVFFLAHHDPLTKLPNREVMRERVAFAVRQAQVQSQKCAVIWIDLDNFKDINDISGHAVGDRLLCEVARLLTRELPSDALITRYGGDEFVVLCENLPDALEARLVSQQLRRLLNTSIDLGDRSAILGASVGLAVFPDDAASADELIKHADLALFQAKAEGRGRFQRFTPKLRSDLERKRTLCKDLPKAVEHGDLEAFFQPIVFARDGRLAGFETLARWHHPDLGSIPPPEFVRLAEEQGCIKPLTDLIIQSAIKAARNWPEDIRFSVNVTPNQLDAALVDQVRELLRVSSFEPGRLEIEVTEDALIRDFDHTSGIFSRLRSIGVQIAMDDFGAGYTSVANLRRLNFDRIKIDRLFTTDLPGHRRSEAIVRAMVVLARELNLTVTVEGIETEEQLTHLQSEGCDELQGYLFSRPLPAAALTDLLAFRRSPKIGPAPDPMASKLLLSA